MGSMFGKPKKVKELETKLEEYKRKLENCTKELEYKNVNYEVSVGGKSRKHRNYKKHTYKLRKNKY